MQKTTLTKPSTRKQKWWVVDASGKTLGRLATRLATVLMGKHKPGYTPHVDTGDYVIVTNAGKVHVTGRKLEQKEYKRYTGYMDGLKIEKMGKLLARKPEIIITLAVRRMVPKGRLGRRMLKKLRVFPGDAHPHAAQKPETLVVS
ncbi:MAG: 50S ribosomal protein L13 [Planctomycetota bacterium]